MRITVRRRLSIAASGWRRASLCTKRILRSVLVGVLVLSAFGESGASASASSECPLPREKQQAAVDAFAAMVPTFQHPRCVNCHGAVNPFVSESEGHHLGGKISRVMEPAANDAAFG